MSDQTLVVPDDLLNSVRDLPVLPTAVTRLLSITQQAEVGIGEIARVIESDPTLMARTLHVANSPLCGTPRRVKTAQQATVLLGIDAIVSLAVGVSVASVQNQLHAKLPIDADAFGRHSIAVALVTRKLARRVKFPSPGEAFVAGLLHDIGKLVLLMHYGEAYADLMMRASMGEKPLHALEQETYGLDHAVAGQALCRHWNVPASIAEAVATHHTASAPHSLGDLVGAANDLVKTIQLGYSGNRFIAAVQGTPGDLSAPGWLRALIVSLQAEITEAEEALGHGKARNGQQKQIDCPLVQLQIGHPEEQTLLMSMLLAMGFEPAEMTDSSVFDAPSRPFAIITEAPPSDRQRQAYQQLDVAVLDYAAFRDEHKVAVERPIDVYLLGAWLTGCLAA